MARSKSPKLKDAMRRDEPLFPAEIYTLPDGTCDSFIDARTLWAELNVGRAFGHWIKELIQALQLIEGTDYVQAAHRREVLFRGIDYHLRPDVALRVAVAYRGGARGKVPHGMPELQRENAQLRSFLELQVREYVGRHPQAALIVRLACTTSLTDEQRAEQLGWDVDTWRAAVATLDQLGVFFMSDVTASGSAAGVVAAAPTLGQAA